MMLLRLAWRNLWRNSRRSFVLLTSIIVGVAAMDWMDGLTRGFVAQVLDNQLGAHTAHLQIHAAGYSNDRVVQNFMPAPGAAITALQNSPYVHRFSPRVATSGLLSSATNSSGVIIVGIQPAQEALVTTIHQGITEGKYFERGGHEIVISSHLARTLNVGLGDRLVAMASALDGTVGAEMFRVVGLYRSSSLSFDRSHVYVPIALAQEMLRVGHRIAEIAVTASTIDSVEVLKSDLASALGPDYEVSSYRDLLPSLVSQVEIMSSMMLVVGNLIGAALLFGVVNTFLMAVYERIHEFGVLNSLGMKNRYVLTMIALEASLIGFIGCVIGTLLGGGTVLLAGKVGLNLARFSEGLAGWGTGAVLYPLVDWGSITIGAAMILLICVLSALYPAWRARSLGPAEAILYV